MKIGIIIFIKWCALKPVCSYLFSETCGWTINNHTVRLKRKHVYVQTGCKLLLNKPAAWSHEHVRTNIFLVWWLKGEVVHHRINSHLSLPAVPLQVGKARCHWLCNPFKMRADGPLMCAANETSSLIWRLISSVINQASRAEPWSLIKANDHNKNTDVLNLNY